MAGRKWGADTGIERSQTNLSESDFPKPAITLDVETAHAIAPADRQHHQEHRDRLNTYVMLSPKPITLLPLGERYLPLAAGQHSDTTAFLAAEPPQKGLPLRKRKVLGVATVARMMSSLACCHLHRIATVEVRPNQAWPPTLIRTREGCSITWSHVVWAHPASSPTHT